MLHKLSVGVKNKNRWIKIVYVLHVNITTFSTPKTPTKTDRPTNPFRFGMLPRRQKSNAGQPVEWRIDSPRPVAASLALLIAHAQYTAV